MLIVLLVFGLAPGTCLRSAVPSPNLSNRLDFVPVALEGDCYNAGPLQLDQALQLPSSPVQFGGYSALLRMNSGRLITFSDRGNFMEFAELGAVLGAPRFGSF